MKFKFWFKEVKSLKKGKMVFLRTEASNGKEANGGMERTSFELRFRRGRDTIVDELDSIVGEIKVGLEMLFKTLRDTKMI